MKNRYYEIDMCRGPLLPKILRFAVPLIVSGTLQLLFNAADMIVVGNFTGKEALAAVGATSALTQLLIQLFLGLSLGVNVAVARFVGAGDAKNTGETVHTAVLLSFVCGGFLVLFGLVLIRPLLVLMGTPADVLDQAVLYMQIYFFSMPAVMLYNFGAAVLNAIGDTRRPMIILTLAGVLNVLCNLLFVIVLKWGVAGVAFATALAQVLSAALVLTCLIRSDGAYRVEWRRLRIHRDKLFLMIRIGLPAGIQGVLFSGANVLIQSSLNTFGSAAMAGNTAAGNINGFSGAFVTAFVQTNISFVSQNIGAKKYSRINRIVLLCEASVTTCGMILCSIYFLFGEQLLHIYTSDPVVISYGIQRLHLVSSLCFIAGYMDVMVGAIRGLGYSMLPTLVSLAGACGFRIIWIYTVFAAYPTLPVLLFCLPASWIVTAACHTICFFVIRRKLPKTDAAAPHEAAAAVS